MQQQRYPINTGARNYEEKQPVLFQPIPVLDDSTVLRMPLVRTTAGAATCAPGRLLVIGGAPETSMCSAEVREGYMSSDGKHPNMLFMRFMTYKGCLFSNALIFWMSLEVP